MYINTSQGEGDMQGSWNSGAQWDRIDDLNDVMPADSGDGTASVALGPDEATALKKMMKRLKSDPKTDPMTGVDLGAGPGAGKITDEDLGGAADIHVAPAKGEAAAVKEMAGK